MFNIVESNNVRIAIDPGADLGPLRYGLPPHELEIKALERALEKICKELYDSDIIVITHYHKDHYIHSDFCIEAFNNKMIIMKDPLNEINFNQKSRANELIKKLKERSQLIFTNGNYQYKAGNLRVEVVGLFWHGSIGTPLGKVLSIYLSDKDNSYLFGSDVQGPIDPNMLSWISTHAPEIIYLSGPPFYLAGSIPSSEIEMGLNNLIKILTISRIKKVIIDHHFAREKNYVRRLVELKKYALKDDIVLDASEFMGVERKPLESLRDELYRQES